MTMRWSWTSMIETIDNDTERDNFMSADEATKYGMIDQVLRERHGESEDK